MMERTTTSTRDRISRQSNDGPAGNMMRSGREPRNNPSVAAVVLSYNSVDTLRASLEAIRAQTFRVRQLSVVDNGSTDATRDWLARERIQAVLLAGNAGVGAGHNAGWRAALEAEPSADYIWALEHDSEPAPDCLARLLDTFRSLDPSGVEIAAVVPRQVHPGDLDGGKVIVTGGRTHRPGSAPYVAPKLTFNAALIRVKAIREVGFLREDFFVGYEDREFAWRLTEAGYAVVHDPNAVVVHRNKGARRRSESRSILRDYYSARNELYLRREVRREPWALARLTTRSTLHVGRVLLRGDRRCARVHARVRALLDGARGDLGQKHYRFLDPRNARA